MELDFMRIVDKYIGIPACFLLSAIEELKILISPAKSKNKKASPKNIIFIEISEMGSSIIAYPAIKKIKSTHPKANIYFLTFRKNRKSIDILKIISKSHVLTVSNESIFALLFDTLKIIFTLRRLKIDTILDLELFARYTSIISYLSGAKTRVGFHQYYQEGLYRGTFQTHKVYYNPHQHMAYNFLSQALAIDSKKETPLLKKNLLNSEIKLPGIEFNKEKLLNRLMRQGSCLQKENRLIILNPNAGLLPIRAWPLENYIALSEKILQAHKDAYIIITGVGDSAGDDAKAICKALSHTRCLDLTNKTTLEELIDLFSLASVLITNDSGPAHFAALTPVKSIVFFGPETPKLYSPLGNNSISLFANYSCSPCVSAFNHRKTPCKDSKCLKAITVEQVFETFNQLYSQKQDKK